MYTRVNQQGFIYRQPCSSQNDCARGSYCNKGVFDARGVCERSRRNEVEFAADVQEEMNRREEQRRINRKISEEYDMWWNSLSWQERAFRNVISILFVVALFGILLWINAIEQQRMRDTMKTT
jgi:hypothetical protein